MTQKLKHAPLPYKLGKDIPNGGFEAKEIKDANDELVAEVFTAFDDSHYSPAFIVRACNNHYKLVEALKICADKLEDLGRDAYAKDARKALTEAEAI